MYTKTLYASGAAAFFTEWFKLKFLLAGLLFVWLCYPLVLQRMNPTTVYIEQTVWLLLVLSLLTFILVTGLCWWLLKQFWIIAGLPGIDNLIIKFNDLNTWQQFILLYATFLLLFCGAISCISAIC